MSTPVLNTHNISRLIREAGIGIGLLTSINQHQISIQQNLETTKPHKEIILRRCADYTGLVPMS